MQNLQNLNLKGKRVLIRVDFNVPLFQGVVSDDFRIRASLPTIKHCINEGASVVLMSHLGRPKGENNPEYSLDPVAFKLEELMDREVMFFENCVGSDAINLSRQMLPREIHLLENLRYHKGETNNENEFSNKLAQHGDIYINDAFGTAHRTHASNVGVLNGIKEAAPGFLMEKEIQYLENNLENPVNPFVVVLGGAKIKGKIDLIDHLLEHAQTLLIGGAMAFTFLKAQGENVGASLVDEENLKTAEKILADACKKNINIILPVDVVAAPELSEDSPWRVADLSQLEEDEAGYDIGPETTLNFEMFLSQAQTVIWNGPMGVCELPAFSTGTQAIAGIIRQRTEDGAVSIIGGGDTAAALNDSGVRNGFSHISTGGGSSLELMSGKKLPAIEALKEFGQN